jgi:UDP-N-acetylglucosamine 2-epimerase
MKIFSLVGARPDFMKISKIIMTIEYHNSNLHLPPDELQVEY